MKKAIIFTISLLLLTVIIMTLNIISSTQSKQNIAQLKLELNTVETTNFNAETQKTQLQHFSWRVTESISNQENLLKIRPQFLETLQQANQLLLECAGKVDITEETQQIQQSQQEVLKATTPATIENEIQNVKTAIDKANQKLTTYNIEQEQKNRSTLETNSSTTPPSPAPPKTDWFTTARQILDQVGGAGIPLQQYDGTCGNVTADACSYPGYIQVSSRFASRNYTRQLWTMAHELAHQYQFHIWDTLIASPTYNTLYNSNIEFLANCMTQAKGYTGGDYCTPDQKNWANNLWNGIVTN